MMESTTTMAESYPADSGSSMMKSTLIVFHGASGIGSGWSSPEGVGGMSSSRGTCHRWRHTCQYISTSVATSHSEILIPGFSTFHYVPKSWSHSRERQFGVKDWMS